MFPGSGRGCGLPPGRWAKGEVNEREVGSASGSWWGAGQWGAGRPEAAGNAVWPAETGNAVGSEAAWDTLWPEATGRVVGLRGSAVVKENPGPGCDRGTDPLLPLLGAAGSSTECVCEKGSEGPEYVGWAEVWLAERRCGTTGSWRAATGCGTAGTGVAGVWRATGVWDAGGVWGVAGVWRATGAVVTPVGGTLQSRGPSTNPATSTTGPM